MILTLCHSYILYLQWKLFSVDRVFRARSSIFAPVEVKLKCLVCCGQIPPADLYTVRHIHLNYKIINLSVNVTRMFSSCLQLNFLRIADVLHSFKSLFFAFF